MGTQKTKWFIIISIFGLFLLALSGVVHWMITPMIAKRVLDAEYIGYDKNGSYNHMTQSWENPAYEMKLEIYLFNVVNPAEIIKGARPNLTEKGPYTFIEKQAKTFNISGDRQRVVYRNNRLYFFSENDSCSTCLLDNKVTVPNILFQKLVDYAGFSTVLRFAIETLAKIENETAFITVRVGDLLFDGYKDTLITNICNKPFIKSICKSLDVPDKIGIFYGQNNSNDGTYEIDTGLKDRLLIGKIYSWNNMTSLPNTTWYGPRAREIRGTDGQLFQPFLKQNEVLSIFVTQVCRVVEMEVKNQGEFRNIKTFDYEPAKTMNNITLQKELGFCNPSAPRFFDDVLVQPKNCTPVGLMDISTCNPAKARIYISQPYFYNCPVALNLALDGLRHPTDNDRTFVQIEPTAGVVVRAIRTSQLNLGVVKGNIKFLSQMKDTIIPMLWLNESALIDPDTENMIHQLSSIMKMLPLIVICTLAIGGFCFIGGGAAIFVSNYMSTTDVPLLSEEDDQVEDTSVPIINVPSNEVH